MQLRCVDVNATSSAMLMTSHRRFFNVVLSLCIYWVDKLTLRVYFQVQLKRKKENEIYLFVFILVSVLTGGFLLLQNFSVAISVSPHVCFILVLILISMFLR